jgi:hypothetical protein
MMNRIQHWLSNSTCAAATRQMASTARLTARLRPIAAAGKAGASVGPHISRHIIYHV